MHGETVKNTASLWRVEQAGLSS